MGGARAERGERALGERGVKRTFRGTCSFVNSSTQRCVCSFGSSTHCQETRESVLACGKGVRKGRHAHLATEGQLCHRQEASEAKLGHKARR